MRVRGGRYNRCVTVSVVCASNNCNNNHSAAQRGSDVRSSPGVRVRGDGRGLEYGPQSTSDATSRPAVAMSRVMLCVRAGMHKLFTVGSLVSF